MNRSKLLTWTLVATFAAAGLASAPAEAGLWKWLQSRSPRPDLAETLKKKGNYKTLLALVELAGLSGALTGDDNLTVLAPTDAAFAKLPKETVDFLTDPDNRDVLRAVLLHHVVPGKQGALRLLGKTTVETLQEKPVLIKLQKRRVFIDDARVLKANIRASNGIIHCIDAVLSIPEEPCDVNNVVDLLVLDGRFSTLISLVGKAGLVDALTGKGPITVFAPTNEAFAKLPKETVDFLTDPANKDVLIDILTYHVAGGELGALRLLAMRKVETLEGSKVHVRLRGKTVLVNNSKVINANLRAPNGIVHVLDTVLSLPE